jgi:hypothetical protein
VGTVAASAAPPVPAALDRASDWDARVSLRTVTATMPVAATLPTPMTVVTTTASRFPLDLRLIARLLLACPCVFFNDDKDFFQLS